MFGLLNAYREEPGLSNIHASVTGWEDDWDKAGIGEHDLAITSRSLIVDDLRTLLEKLNLKAWHRVYIASLIDDGLFDRRTFMRGDLGTLALKEAIHRQFAVDAPDGLSSPT